ncbi:hypothetical protein [Nonomuraea sp. NPDC049480]|uniref:hypothetical protein n=1 Tax=Nonomuraea sp. NPDC049480 TaxID=3364353 RepID=UPI0037A2B10A
MPRCQHRLLLGVLALSANRVVPLQRLAEVFWPDGARHGVRIDPMAVDVHHFAPYAPAFPPAPKQ